MLKAKTGRRERKEREKALKSVTEDEVIRLNALIPNGLHKRLKMEAVRLGKGYTITSIVIEALEEYMIKNSHE
jgi:hypothetical protein